MFQLVNRKLFNLLLKGTDVAWNRIPTSTTPNHLFVRLDNVNKYAMRSKFAGPTHTKHGGGWKQTPDSLDGYLESIDALQKIKNLDPEAHFKALDKLMNEPSCRAVFLRLPDDRKKDWVLAL